MKGLKHFLPAIHDYKHCLDESNFYGIFNLLVKTRQMLVQTSAGVFARTPLSKVADMLFQHNLYEHHK